MADSVRSVDRALDIIEQLSQAGTPLGPTKIAELTGMDKSTVFRLLATLKSRGYVSKDENTGTYSLGVTLLTITSRYLGSLELQTEARPFLSELATDLGLTTHLGMLDGCEVVYVEKLDYVPTPQLYRQIGNRVPAYCSSLGKCLLACLSGDDLTAAMANCPFTQYTNTTITNLRALREHLRQVRAQGYAIDDEESQANHICVGAPIYDYRGEIIAAVSASGSKSVVMRQGLPQVIDSVKRAAAGISKRMGHFE
ncbi:MAG: IclR family transcriptional regulator [Oscillospiraceae bacterium]|nr:IclR family transcriptional regulator [Oscillospiraceae bacterium]